MEASRTRYFGTFWVAWTLGAEYGARYNDDDLAHKIFWGLYGLGVVGMVAHASGGPVGANAGPFCGAAAAVAFLVALMKARVACSFASRFDASARKTATSATWHAAVYGAMGMLWVAAARSNRHRRLACWWLAVALEPLGDVIYSRLYGAEGLVPLSEKYLVSKFTNILVIVLSVNVTRAAAAADPTKFPVEDRGTLRLACAAAYVLFVNFKLLAVDVDAGVRLRDPFGFRASPRRVL